MQQYLLVAAATVDPSPAFQSLVITQNFRDSRLLLFALEGRRILAGGETTGSRRPILRAPAGARDVNEFDEIVQDRATVPRPCRGAKAIMTGFPVVSPPANIRCASGAKLKNLGNDKFSKPGEQSHSGFSRGSDG
jgi:hypothetical protein